MPAHDRFYPSLIFFVCPSSRHSPDRAEACSGSARFGSIGVTSPRGPPEAAARTAGEPAEGERGGSTERERKANRGKRKGGRKGGGELWEKNICFSAWSLCTSSLFYFIICRSGPEAAGTLWKAGEAAESSKKWAEEDVSRSRSFYHHDSALLPQGSKLEKYIVYTLINPSIPT